MASLHSYQTRARDGFGTMGEKLFAYRRPALVALTIAIILLIFEGFYLWGDSWSPKDAFSAIIPTVNKPTEATDHTHSNAPVPNEKPEYTPAIPDIAEESADSEDESASPPAQPTSEVKTSMLHYLVPASSPNDMFCAVVASGLVNRYPIPYVIGWKGEGKYNASAAHFAKLYTIKRYLDDLPNGGEDDDLIVFGDGHDVVAQLPVEVMIERYFEVAAAADRRLADRFGISVEEAHERGLRQTLFWGADKMCWPPLYNEAQCSKIPGSHLPQNVFGLKSGNQDYTYREAKFLNSGSVIGPVGDLRKFVDAGIAEMETTFDEEFKYKNSDQVYLSRIFGRQEISRTEQVTAAANDEAEETKKPKEPKKATNPKKSGDTDEVGAVDDSEETDGPGLTGEKRATFVKSGKHSTDVVEYHLAIDYESTFVQTGCYSHKWMYKLQYNNSDNSATMKEDIIMHGEYFQPYQIQMPANVYKAFRRVFDSLGDDQPTTSARAWISNLKLDTNVITKTIFGFYHATCSKKVLIKDFKTYWFHPLLEPLMKAAVRTINADEPITDKLIDGRKWVYKKMYPSSEQAEEELGGVFTDYNQEGFIAYKELCGGHMGIFEP